MEGKELGKRQRQVLIKTDALGGPSVVFRGTGLTQACAGSRHDKFKTGHLLGKMVCSYIASHVKVTENPDYVDKHKGVSEQILNGTSAHYRPFSAINCGQ